MGPINKKDENEAPKPAMPQLQPSEGPMCSEQKSQRSKEGEILSSRRQELINKEHLTDNEISERLASELKRTSKSIASQIWRLIDSKRLEENPYKQKGFSDEENSKLISRRQELIHKEHITDKVISKQLAPELKRTPASIGGHIRTLIKSKQLEENPNKKERREFSDEENAKLILRRPEFINRERLTDAEISKRLAPELKRTPGSIRVQIRTLIKSKQLDENPYKVKDLSDKETAKIISRRQELIDKEHLTDNEISKRLAPKLKRSSGSISNHIRRLIESKQLEENPNKRGRKEFSDKENAKLISRRQELIDKEYLTDKTISGRLASELDRTPASIDFQIRKLINAKKLEENPNKQKQFSDEENANIISRRQELIDNEHLKDGEISNRLVSELNRTPNAINTQIRKLVKSKNLEENPYKTKCSNTEDAKSQIEALLRKYVEQEGSAEAGS